MTLDLETLDEVLLPERRQSGKARALNWEITRVLELGDLESLMDAGALTPIPSGGNLTQVRSAHHLLAQLCAEGKSSIEIGLITGYSPGYISLLRNNDPAFRELLAHYSTQREKVYVDALERMKLVGITSLEELQNRLASQPEKFRNSELLQIAEILLVKGANAGGTGSSSGPAVNISVNFVPSESAQPSGAPTIDLEANK